MIFKKASLKIIFLFFAVQIVRAQTNALASFASIHQQASVSVLTYHNNNARTGANTNETLLTLANVNSNTFGLLIKYPVDGYIYGQPLYVPGLMIPGQGRHNVVFVTTANNSVYAFDAENDTGENHGLLWHDDLGEGIDLVNHHEFGGRYHNNVFQDMLPKIGILGTPVIDLTNNTLFVDVFTRTENDDGPHFHHKIHALNLDDGSERPFSPVEVTASAPGTGFDSSNGVVIFNPRQHIQRPALTLAGGILYVAYGSAADTDPYHGWIIGYDARNLQLLTNYVFITTPDATLARFGSHAGEGALWMGGDGLCVDAQTNLYFEVANGSFDADPSLGGGQDYGDSFMKLSTTGNRLAVTDFFTPFDQAKMQAYDSDFGSGGALLLPDEVGSVAHPHLIIGGDKASNIYLVDRENMGHYNSTNNHQIVEETYADTGRFFSTPAYFNFHIYCQGIGGVMKAYAISNGWISSTPDSKTRTSFSGMGTTPSISANGTHDAILWSIQSDGAVQHMPAVLHAYNATNLAMELYNSNQLPGRDNPGNAVKMTVPTVADGKVFVGAQSDLAIYGNGIFLPPPSISPIASDFTNSVTVTLTDTDPSAHIFYTLDGTSPTIHSLQYGQQLILTNSVTLRAIATKPGAVDSMVTTTSFNNTAVAGNGDGLLGQYWTKIVTNFTNAVFSVPPTITSTDATINFDFHTAGPILNSGPLLARWSGSIQSPYSDNYQFAVVSHGGVRLWINDQLMIDDWTNHAAIITNQASLQLSAQQFYNVRLDYFGARDGVIQWLWKRKSISFAVIPKSQLYSRKNPAPTISFVAPPDGSGFSGSASVTIGANATAALNQIRQVEFFANGKLIGSLENSLYAPVYAITTTGISEGHYALTAVAMDASGLCSTSAPIHITVAAGMGQTYGLTNRALVEPFLKMPDTFGDAIPKLLSDTGVFSDTASRTAAPGLIPYGLNAPAWDDGAEKSYLMAVPKSTGIITPDEQLRFRPTGSWKFPNGTVFVKNLDLVVNESSSNAPRRRLETQILVRDNNGAVYGATYKWRLDNQDADLVTAGMSEDILITNTTGVRTQSWYYASPADCLTCHTPAAGYVLGVNTSQLNGNFVYPSTGNVDNQIRTLNRLGLFSPAPDESRIASFQKLSALTDTNASLENRVRSYLDANCADCHRPGAVGIYDASYDTPFAEKHIINTPAVVTLGLSHAHIVKPGDVSQSVLFQRIVNISPGVKMPPLSHNRVDTLAAKTMSEWISNLKPAE